MRLSSGYGTLQDVVASEYFFEIEGLFGVYSRTVGVLNGVT